MAETIACILHEDSMKVFACVSKGDKAVMGRVSIEISGISAFTPWAKKVLVGFWVDLGGKSR